MTDRKNLPEHTDRSQNIASRFWPVGKVTSDVREYCAALEAQANQGLPGWDEPPPRDGSI